MINIKKYKVIDEQGCNFMEDTHNEPMTANELRSRFWGLDDCRTNKYKDFTIDYIQEMWAVTFEEVNNINDYKGICLECSKESYMERDIQLCDNCVDKFDLDKLWKMHDNNEIDALDFNESERVREQFRLKGGK